MSDNDKKAAEEYCHTKFEHDGTYSCHECGGIQQETFLAGCAHKEKELEAEREQIARDAFEAGYKKNAPSYGYIVEDMARDINDYWQQKQKERTL